MFSWMWLDYIPTLLTYFLNITWQDNGLILMKYTALMVRLGKLLPDVFRLLAIQYQNARIFRKSNRIHGCGVGKPCVNS